MWSRFLLFLLFYTNLFAIQKCGIKTVDGKELICPEGFSCSFGNIKNQLNCKCVGYVDDPFKRGAKQQIYSPCLAEEIIENENLSNKENKTLVSASKSSDNKEFEKKKDKAKAELVRTFVMSGDSYYAQKEYDKAISQWYKAISVDEKAAVKLNPFIAKAYAKKGIEDYKKGNYESALINFNEAIKLDPYNENILQAKAKTEAALELRKNTQTISNTQQIPKPQENLTSKQPFEINFQKEEKNTEKIFSLFRVVGWISIICFAFFLPWGRNFLISGLHLLVFLLINIFLPFLFGPMIIITSIWVFYDSSKILKDIPYQDRKKIFRFILFPGSWTGASLFFWPLFYPLYLTKRFDYLEFKNSKPKEEDLKAVKEPEKKAEEINLKDFIKKGEYDKALKFLSALPEHKIADYKYFLEIYIKIEDFIRARLTLNKILEKIALGEKETNYEFYIAMGILCKHKKQNDMAYELLKLAFEIMKNEIPIDKNPSEFYTLAVNLENEGEIELAKEVYKYFEMKQIYYSDVSERLKRLSEKKISTRPVQQGAIQIIAGRYSISKILGSGGMGIVYQAKDEKTGNIVAVKQIHSSLKEYPEEFKRFLKEAEIVKKLKHPNIVSVLDVVEDNGETYLVFDYVDGKNLAAILKEKVRLPLNECKEIMKDICDAVHYAHKNNIIHRDIKPANIMINSKGVVKIMDFGLACELKEAMTRVTHQTMSGTPAYMAPEQYEGIVKKESDIYAIGVCLYEMLSGELPFKTLDFQKDKKNKNYEEITSKLPWLPAAIDKIIDKALEPEPSMRYADAMDLWLDLKEIK